MSEFLQVAMQRRRPLFRLNDVISHQQLFGPPPNPPARADTAAALVPTVLCGSGGSGGGANDGGGGDGRIIWEGHLPHGRKIEKEDPEEVSFVFNQCHC